MRVEILTDVEIFPTPISKKHKNKS